MAAVTSCENREYVYWVLHSWFWSDSGFLDFFTPFETLVLLACEKFKVAVATPSPGEL